MVTKKITSLFSQEFLDRYLESERLSVFGDIRKKMTVLSDWIASLDAGKLDMSKEAGLKSRFVTEFFGDVLGFNYRNSKYWHLEEEFKNQLDGQRTDASLGYFEGVEGKIVSDVRIVVEIKGVEADLDARPKKDVMSPVEQAFNYSTGQGPNVKWVIVSNFTETRFYASNSRSKYQVFFLKDLESNDKLRELLFLFHKDYLINQNEKSRTDRLFELSRDDQKIEFGKIHIVDRIYDKLRQFDGIEFVDPNYLCTLKPFNILEEHVWHYENRTLFTINPEIYNLFIGASLNDDRIELTETVRQELSKNVVDFENKLDYIIKKLNKCFIFNITAIKDYKAYISRNRNTIGFSLTHTFSYRKEDAVKVSIKRSSDDSCDCIICNYRNLDFGILTRKIKSAHNHEDKFTFEYAYGNYLMRCNDFKDTYSILKSLEQETKGKEHKEIKYFLSKYNILRLHNLIKDYYMEDQADILSVIKSVDMDKVVYNEIEFHVSDDVKRYLLDIKNDELNRRVSEKIEDYACKIDKVRKDCENGTTYTFMPDYTDLLYREYCLLFAHVHQNYLIHTVFSDYKRITEKMFNAFVQSYLTSGPRISSFNDFMITEAILHINCSSLKEIMDEVFTLEVDPSSKTKFLKKILSFLNSYTEKSLFGDPIKNSLLQENLLGFSFRNDYTNIFANLFLFLQKIDVTKDDLMAIIPSLINYLKVEDELAHFHIKPLVDCIKKKAHIFTSDQLYELLKIAIKGDERHKPKYRALIDQICRSLNSHYPEFKIKDKKIVIRAVSNCYTEGGSKAGFTHIMFLLNVLDEPNKKYLVKVFEEYLDEQFDDYFYVDLIRNGLLDYKYKDYFMQYIKPWSNYHCSDFIGVENGHPRFKRLDIYNILLLIYVLDIDFDHEALKTLDKLIGFEKWLLNPVTFDYAVFETDWLIAANNSYILERISRIKPIRKSLRVRLKQNYDNTLSEIYHKYFA